MQIYYASIPLDEGFTILENREKGARVVQGRQVSRPSGWALFHHMKGTPIRCHFCGCEADQWVAEKGQRDKVGHPVLNLYAGSRMMTRDHIIPRSLGGKDCVENLRPACAPCNESRSNEVDQEVIRFAQEHPELVDKERIAKGLESLREAVSRLRASIDCQENEIQRLEKPFRDMGYL